MTKGIRAFTNEIFVKDLPQRAEIGNTEFRKGVINQVVMAFGITVASASTHYNHALKMVRATSPELVEGLGRPEDKKGGRKPKVVVVDLPAETPAEAALATGAMPAEAALA